MTMIRDEAIEEIRERRRQLFKKKFAGSVDRLFDDAEKRHKTRRSHIVHPVRTDEKKRVYA